MEKHPTMEPLELVLEKGVFISLKLLSPKSKSAVLHVLITDQIRFLFKFNYEIKTGSPLKNKI